MHTDDVREQGFERALRQSVAMPAAVAPGDCVDPETLAAWSDGSLPATQAVSVELHLSSCPSCQALLAAFVRAVPAQPAALPFWRRWQLQWLVPLATATAALTLWLVIPGRTPASLEPAREDRPVAQLSVPSTPPIPSEPRDQSSRFAAPSSLATPPPGLPPAAAGRTATPPPAQLRAAAEDALAKSLQEKQKKEADGRLTTAAEVAQPDVAGAARQAEALDRARAAVEDTRTAAGPPPVPTIPAAPPAAVMAAAPPPSVAAAEPPVAQPAAARPAGARQEPIAGAFAQSRALKVVSIDVASPTSATRWRLAAGGAIDYFSKSASAGRRTDIPAPTTIVAGSSPQDDVCWMVGRSGAVYLTTDGTHFTRIAFPEPVDLIAVRATDAKTATVTTASGRTYQTTDSGQTWHSQ